MENRYGSAAAKHTLRLPHCSTVFRAPSALNRYISLSCVYTCEHFVHEHDVRVISVVVANHLLSVLSMNTKDVRGLGTVFIWIFVLVHVCGKIFLSRQQFLRNCCRSWFVIFPIFWTCSRTPHSQVVFASVYVALPTNNNLARFKKYRFFVWRKPVIYIWGTLQKTHRHHLLIDK